ncbi:sensor histidine kinase [Gryllotalpicola protaetiae]|uniref:histidine kinase n=1 Tax=Gryllotalpicola protaetiae TaxID=2419771 RepID=A0A387BRE6_9MICO|nr:histidine kinase [Gryllotalpicola protaetiae]AYG05152.1 two-component sensor histidine kinase [Gryllotalpicola protaetiae]
MSSVEPQDDLRLPRQPGVVRRFWARHERLADWLIALFWGLPATLITLATLVRSTEGTAHAWWPLTATLIVAASCIGFFVRRTRPILAFAILCAALIPAPFTDASPEQVLPVVGVYSLAVYRSNAAAWIGAAAVEGVSTLYVWLISPLGTNQTLAHSPAQWFPVYGIELLVALAIGITVGNRRRYLDALIDRAHQLARERDQQALLAAVAERARIARDMHDVVSHSLTVMVTLAEGSAAAAETDPSRAAAAMRQVADTGREALAGMRQMLGVLGSESEAATLAPQPTVADIPRLIERFRDLGLPVTLSSAGDVPAEPALQLAVYRIVQEGLTNALRYSHGPTRVDVLIDADGDPLAVVVDDDGLPGMPTVSVGAGRGLLGLTERVSTLGGTLASGHHDSGAGWRLAAALPRNPAHPAEETA